MRVIIILLVSCISIVATGPLSCYASGSDATVQPDTQSFSNRDLDKYSSPSDNSPVISKKALKEETGKTGGREQKEKEYWCKKAGVPRKKIEKAKDDIKEIEDSGSRTKAAKKKLDASKKRLKAAERDLSDLGDEAYRKGIPPGWLRCQFE